MPRPRILDPSTRVGWEEAIAESLNLPKLATRLYERVFEELYCRLRRIEGTVVMPLSDALGAAEREAKDNPALAYGRLHIAASEAVAYLRREVEEVKKTVEGGLVP